MPRYNTQGGWWQLWAEARTSPSTMMTASTNKHFIGIWWTTGSWGQMWAEVLVGPSSEGNFSTEAERRGLATEELEFLISVCQDTLILTPGDLTQPLLSCITKMQTCPTTQPCQVISKASCFLLVHIYSHVFKHCGNCKVLLFSHLAEFVKAGSKTVSGLINILNITLIS